MMNRINWAAVLVFVAVVFVVVACGLSLLLVASGFLQVPVGVRLGPGGMMGGGCPWCGGTGLLGGRGLIGLLVVFVVPLTLFGLFGLLLVGALWLARSVRGTPGGPPEDES
jgi:hypothetical protein